MASSPSSTRWAGCPGRKSLILFSEGIAIPAAVHRLFLGVIDAANRANVSIYTIDAAGLRAESDQAAIRDRVNAAAAVGINTGYATDGGGGAMTGGSRTTRTDLRQRSARPASASSRSDTGGLLFNSTNNLRPAFERIDSDLPELLPRLATHRRTPRSTAGSARFRSR